MRITIDRSLTDTHDVELEAVAGASLSEVLEGNTSKRAWCGSTLLEPSHDVGTYPLLHGARLRDGPGPLTTRVPGLHLAAIAGPDAGIVIEVDDLVTVGSAPGRHQIRDDAMDPSHVLVRPVGGDALECRDLGSTNGSGWWRQDGERWWWSGRRRRFTARQGDIITLGSTALQVRGAGVAAPFRGLRRLPLAAAQLLAALPWTPVPAWPGLPDPTVVAGWTGSVVITGPRAREAARAVILARGRRPPRPPPLDEDWLRWLPEPLASDGPIHCGPSVRVPGETTLEADTTACLVRQAAAVKSALPVAVSLPTADALARSLAGAATVPWPHAVRWADVDEPRSHTQDVADLSVTMGTICSPDREPWIIVLNAHTPHLVASGASKTGASTLLATLVSGLAHHYTSRRLRMILVGSAADGPLTPCATLPHVTIATSSAGDDDAGRALDAAAQEARERRAALLASRMPDWVTWEASGEAPGRLLVVVDDFDLATGRSRAAAAAIDALAAPSLYVGVHVALATHRPAGAITPALRTSCGHAIALRSASESDSLGVIGVPDAATLARLPGRAISSTPGKRVMVHVALPAADPSPRVRRADVATAPARHLAEVITRRTTQELSAAPPLP